MAIMLDELVTTHGKEERRGKGKGLKEKCCGKYRKKGKHCSRCPLAADCEVFQQR